METSEIWAGSGKSQEGEPFRERGAGLAGRSLPGLNGQAEPPGACVGWRGRDGCPSLPLTSSEEHPLRIVLLQSRLLSLFLCIGRTLAMPVKLSWFYG